MVFSVADMQAREHEAYENEEENEDSESDDVPIHTYGVHVALTVTKVRLWIFLRTSSC